NAHGGKIDYPSFCPRRIEKGGRKVKPDGPEECTEIPGPADCYRRDRKAVFEDEVPTDDPCPDLAERHVAVCISAPGKRDHGGKFCIAQRGKEAGYTGKDKREREGVTRMQPGDKAGQDKDTHTDDAPDTEHDQVKCAQGAGKGFAVVEIGHLPFDLLFFEHRMVKE